MSATPTETSNYDPVELNRNIRGILPGGGHARTPDKGRQIYEAIRDGWDLPETYIDDGQAGVPVSRFANALFESHEEVGDNPNEETLAETLYGVRHPFLAGMLTGPEYEKGGGVRDMDAMLEHARSATPDSERALVDNSVVSAASPVVIDPEILSILRSAAPVLDVIPTVQQAGFTASYNVFITRTLNEYFQTESEAADLSDSTASDFAVDNEDRDMKIAATLIDVGDFSQRAEETLDYMDLMNTTVGQVMEEWFIETAKAYLYGDTSGTGSGNFEDANGYDGLAKIAEQASNVNNKTAVSSGRLEDMLDFLTARTQDSSLTFGRGRYLVSPAFYNAIYDEVTPVVRIDGYDAPVEFGPRGLALGHERGVVPITPVDGIRDLQSESTGGEAANSTDGDVFLYDERAIQFRALMPTSTVPLGRLGLADRAALFYYGTIIDKTLDDDNNNSNTHRLRYGDV